MKPWSCTIPAELGILPRGVEKKFWNKIDKEYQDEIAGIAEDCSAKGKHYDIYDLVVLKAISSCPVIMCPSSLEKIKPGSANNKALAISGFIARQLYPMGKMRHRPQ